MIRSGGKGVPSPWPPVALIAWLETSIRGPWAIPASMAFRRPTETKSREPTSRTVVKPASSVRRAYIAAYCACSAGGRMMPE